MYTGRLMAGIHYHLIVDNADKIDVLPVGSENVLYGSENGKHSASSGSQLPLDSSQESCFLIMESLCEGGREHLESGTCKDSRIADRWKKNTWPVHAIVLLAVTEHAPLRRVG